MGLLSVIRRLSLGALLSGVRGRGAVALDVSDGWGSDFQGGSSESESEDSGASGLEEEGEEGRKRGKGQQMRARQEGFGAHQETGTKRSKRDIETSRKMDILMATQKEGNAKLYVALKVRRGVRRMRNRL